MPGSAIVCSVQCVSQGADGDHAADAAETVEVVIFPSLDVVALLSIYCFFPLFPDGEFSRTQQLPKTASRKRRRTDL